MKRIVMLIAVACGLASGTGCTRSEVTRDARDVASDVRNAAAAAGDRLADSWLTAKVQARFFADDEVKARDVDVSSRDGAVTLEGVVGSDVLRHRALALARGVEGVRHVEDRLIVGQESAERLAEEAVSTGRDPTPSTGSTSDQIDRAGGDIPDDSMVTSLIQARYFLDPHLKLRSIDVATSNRIVTLRGEVASDDERARALLLARTAAGVERVEDGLSVDAALTVRETAATGSAERLSSAPIAGAPVGPPPAPTATSGSTQTSREAGAAAVDAPLEQDIRAKLAADPQLRGAGLEVSARDGVVVLAGTVANAAARQRAIALARGSRGVSQVIDRITVQ